MPYRALAAAVFGLILASCSPAAEAPPPAPNEAASLGDVGDCFETTVVSVGPRLEGVPDSGSTITYESGLSQIDYARVAGIDNSQAGDRVRVCLVSVPENCPPGDDRGRVYTSTNLRTNETWTAPDSQHSCGGA